MFKLAHYLKPYRLQVILGPIFKLIEAIFELIIPIVTAQIIDQGVKTGDVGYVWRMGGVMLLLGVVGLCSALVCQKMGSIASQGFGTIVRNELYEHILSLIHISRQLGQFLYGVGNDAVVFFFQHIAHCVNIACFCLIQATGPYIRLDFFCRSLRKCFQRRKSFK